MVPDIAKLFEVLRRFGEERNWHLKYAKFNWRIHQSLLAHCLNVSSLSYSLLDYLDEQKFVQATNKLRIQVFLTGFLHDSGKESDSYQMAVNDFLAGGIGEPLDFDHQHAIDVRPVVESLQKVVEDKFPMVKEFTSLWDEIIWSITQMGRREDAASVSQTFQRAPSDDALLSKEVVHLADVMMSKLRVEDVASIVPDGQTVSKLQLTYSKVAVVRGVLTQFLHAALESQLTDHTGFRSVQWFPDGTVYVGRAQTEIPRINSAAIADSVARKMQDVLDKSRPVQMAKAAYGSLTAQVIAAPEFLFADNDIIHEFWRYISTQRFAKPSVKEIDELTETEKKLYEQISVRLSGKDESTKLTLLTRFLSDFNLLVILYAARKQLVESVNGVRRRVIEEEVNRGIQQKLVKILRIPLASVVAWPEIALQTKAKSLSVAETLWLSPYYGNPDKWRSVFLTALEQATIELAEIWRKQVSNKYDTVARLLVSDITHPLDPRLIMETVEDLNRVILKGKTGHGTQTCQRCGGVAVHEAQAELFGKSEIYHDNLVAGSKVGGGNKLRVCELCEFEEKLRSVFMIRGQEPFATFYIFPHLALTRNQQFDWQKTANEIELNQGELPPLHRVERWAELVAESDNSSFSLPSVKSNFFSDREYAWAIQEAAVKEGLEGDLSSMIEPPLEAKDGNAVASHLSEGRCKLKERYERQVYKILNRVEPIYLSPNFIILLTNGAVANRDEPESSAAIKWLFFRLILARRFSATVLNGYSVGDEGAMLGYTTVPSNIILKTLVKRLNTRKGWVPIPELDSALRKLSALILTSRELSNAEAGYGNATLLRLLNEEPGRVLVRMTNKNQAYPKRLLSYLDTWNDEKRNVLGDVMDA